jgi:hypothetical protein
MREGQFHFSLCTRYDALFSPTINNKIDHGLVHLVILFCSFCRPVPGAGGGDDVAKRGQRRSSCCHGLHRGTMWIHRICFELMCPRRLLSMPIMPLSRFRRFHTGIHTCQHVRSCTAITLSPLSFWDAHMPTCTPPSCCTLFTVHALFFIPDSIVHSLRWEYSATSG